MIRIDWREKGVDAASGKKITEARFSGVSLGITGSGSTTFIVVKCDDGYVRKVNIVP
jgi:hypothetical protein